MSVDNDRVKIIIATHKKYQMPSDLIYIPLHVGAEGKKNENGVEIDLGYAKDNTGVNISELNPSFCELTGLYWAWKNLNTEFIGLAHYRRHFCLKKKKSRSFDKILTYEDIKPMLRKYKVFLPKKRKYYIETLYSHYEHTHYSNQLDMTRNVVRLKYPEYLESYDSVLQHRYGYMFNMMIMHKNLLNDYCTWLFDILFELKKCIDMPELSKYQGRFYGRISEIIFNVWLDYQIKNGNIKKNEIKELPCVHMEKINWWKKGMSFLKAKYLHKKYEGSF